MKTPKANKQREEDAKWIAGLIKDKHNNLLTEIQKEFRKAIDRKTYPKVLTEWDISNIFRKFDKL